MAKLKIGWQKYEDFLDKQINSPAIEQIIQSMTSKAGEDSEEEDETVYQDGAYEETEDDGGSFMLPMTAQFFQDLSMLSTYDCWLGHTNFDITQSIKQKLDTIEGIEVLKICSRYRFFIGIGRMFEFKNVRSDIEKCIIPEKE